MPFLMLFFLFSAVIFVGTYLSQAGFKDKLVGEYVPVRRVDPGSFLQRAPGIGILFLTDVDDGHGIHRIGVLRDEAKGSGEVLSCLGVFLCGVLEEPCVVVGLR